MITQLNDLLTEAQIEEIGNMTILVGTKKVLELLKSEIGLTIIEAKDIYKGCVASLEAEVEVEEDVVLQITLI